MSNDNLCPTCGNPIVHILMRKRSQSGFFCLTCDKDRAAAQGIDLKMVEAFAELQKAAIKLYGAKKEGE